MISTEDIARYGGKAAILNHLKAALPDLPIPAYVVKRHVQSLDDVAADFEKMKKPVIVRSSSPYEFDDFDGIFETFPNVGGLDSLERAIGQVEKSAISQRAQTYAQQNGYKIGSMMNVIIQEQSPSVWTGAMMRHPNNPDLIFIAMGAGRGYQRNYTLIVWNSKTNSEAALQEYIGGGVDEETARFLVDSYKKIETTAKITEDRSLIVEFGYNPFAVFQVRPFKKFATADFDVPDVDFADGFSTDFAFGVTPPEGIILPVVRGYELGPKGKMYGTIVERGNGIQFMGRDASIRLRLRNLALAEGLTREANGLKAVEHVSKNNLLLDGLVGGPYCFVTPSALRESYDVDLTVPNMRALVIGEAGNFLVHGLMRLFRKADVTLGVPVIYDNEFYNNIESVENRVRVISNGKQATIMKI